MQFNNPHKAYKSPQSARNNNYMYIDKIKLEFQNFGLPFAYTIYWDIHLYFVLTENNKIDGGIRKMIKIGISSICPQANFSQVGGKTKPYGF